MDHKTEFIKGIQTRISRGHEYIDTKIDDLHVKIEIYKLNGKIVISIHDRFLYTPNNIYYHEFYGVDGDYTYNQYFEMNDEGFNQMWDFIQKLAGYKYNKLFSRFDPPEIIESGRRYYESIQHVFNMTKCEVCTDILSEYEKIGCGHNICKKCAQDMIKKKNRNCPLCGKRSVCYTKHKCMDSDDDEDQEEEDDDDEEEEEEEEEEEDDDTKGNA